MAIPAEVVLRTVTYGPETDFEGNPVTGTLTFTPSEDITWVANGQGFHVRAITVSLNSSGAGSKDLICTDQAGFRNAAGQTITNWYYEVRADLTGVAGSTRKFQVPAGTGSLDLDTMIPVTSTSGITVSVPAVINLAGLVGPTVTSGSLKTALALENVNNTSDAGKPVSTAAQTALDLKVPQGSLFIDIADPAYSLPTVGTAADAALAAAYAATPTGGTLYCGDRDITLTGQLSISKKITIRGGRFTCALSRSLIISAAGTVLDGVQAARTGGLGTDNGSAITINAADVVLKDVTASSTVGDALTLASGTSNGARIIRGSYSTAGSAGDGTCGIQALSSSTMNRDIHIIGAKIRHTGYGTGIALYNSSDCLVQECDVKSIRRHPWFTPTGWTLVSGTIYRAVDRTDTVSNAVWVGRTTGTEYTKDSVDETLPTLGHYGTPGDGFIYINTGGVPSGVETTRTSGYGILMYATTSVSEGMCNNLIAFNHVEDTDGFGIYYQTLQLQPKGNRTLNNTLINTCLLGAPVSALPYAGIGVFGGRDTILQGDTIRGTGTATTSPAPGVRLTASTDTVNPSCRLIGVTVEAATGAGFSFNSGTWVATGCVARDCIGSGFSQGTAIASTNLYLDLIGCSAFDNTAATSCGVSMVAGSQNIRVNIDGGVYSGNALRNIYLSSVRDSRVTNVLCHTPGSGYNLHLAGCVRVAVDNATLLTGSGFITDSSCVDLMVGALVYDASGGTKFNMGVAAWRTGTFTWAGTGSPEGVVTATVGSTFTRRDGGTDTTLYVKETGTGNTGWVANAASTGGSTSQFPFLSTMGTSPFVAMNVTTAQTVGTANLGFSVLVKPLANMTVNFLDWVTGSVSAGNYDIGIYNSAGSTKLWSKGSTAYPTASSLVTETVSPGVTLVAGTTYRVILAGSDATANFRGVTFVGGMGKLTDGTVVANNVATGGLPLGASFIVGSASTKVPLIQLRES